MTKKIISVTSHALYPLPCHKLSHLLGPPPPSSVTYFMDGPCRQNVCRRSVVESPYRSPLYGPFRQATNGPFQMRRPLLTSVVHDPTISFNPILIHSNTRLLRTSVTSSLKFSNRSIA